MRRLRVGAVFYERRVPEGIKVLDDNNALYDNDQKGLQSNHEHQRFAVGGAWESEELCDVRLERGVLRLIERGGGCIGLRRVCIIIGRFVLRGP